MYAADEHAGRRRAAAGLATLGLHAGLAALLVWGLAEGGGDAPDDEARLVTVDLSAPPPPPPPPPPPDRSDAAPQPSPGPEGETGKALPREAPEAAIPLAVAPAAPQAEGGRDASAGAGTQGTGSGAGGTGSGEGGGGGQGSPAVRIAGALRDSDYPREAEAGQLAGTVGISFRVRTDGAVDRCAVTRSSGAPLLDDLTCRLFTQRFRFRPATDASGRAVESTLATSFIWGTRRRR